MIVSIRCTAAVMRKVITIVCKAGGGEGQETEHISTARIQEPHLRSMFTIGHHSIKDLLNGTYSPCFRVYEFKFTDLFQDSSHVTAELFSRS